jgi:hypothetical protein
MNTKWLNFFERVSWTLLQVASAEGIVFTLNTIWNADISQAWTVIIATALAAIKNAAAQTIGGSPTGATLPGDVQPVAAEAVVVKLLDNGDLVAGEASPKATGTPIVDRL